MLFNKVVVFVAMLSGVMSAPVVVSEAVSENTNAMEHLIRRATQINDCGDSTFINQSSGGSPSIADCQRLADNIRGSGTWTQNKDRQLAQFGTCAFAVYPTRGGVSFKVGNGDIRDLIFDSIKRFGWQGRVGAKGEMRCEEQFAPQATLIKWAIYHT